MLAMPPGMPMMGQPMPMPGMMQPDAGIGDPWGLSPEASMAMPYGMPEEPRQGPQDDYTFYIPKDPGIAQQLAEEAVALWRLRDERMDEDQRLWELHPPRRRRHKQTVHVTDNAVQVDKCAMILAKAEIIPDMAARDENDRPAAQGIEDLSAYVMDEFELRHVEHGRSPLRFEVSHFGALRGWQAVELLVNARDIEFPWKLRVIDPRQIYPDTEDGKPCFVVHKYTTKQRQLEYDFGRRTVRRALEDTDAGYNPLRGNMPITCYAWYTDKELAILVENGKWLKPPVEHDYGFRPLIYVIGPGAPYRKTDKVGVDSDSVTDEHIRYIGAGFLRTIAPAVKDKQELASMQRTVAAKTADSPVWMTAPNHGEIQKEDVPTNAGEIGVFPTGATLKTEPPPAQALQHTGALLSLTQDEVNRAGFGAAMFGQATGASGYQQNETIGTNIDVISPWAEMTRVFWQSVLRGALRLFARFGPPSVPYVATDRATGMRTAANRISPADVVNADYRLNVELGDLGLHDLQQMGMLASTLVDRGIIDVETALTDFLHRRNPAAIMKRAIRDQFYKDPMLLRLRTLAEKAQDAADPIGAKLAQMLFVSEFQKFSLMASGQPNAQPGAGPNQPPLPNTNMPSQALPSPMGTNAGAGPNGVNLGPLQQGAGLPGM